MSFESPKNLSSEEMGEVEKERVLSDAELIKDGADYSFDEKGNKRLEVTSEQVEEARKGMEKDEYIEKANTFREIGFEDWKDKAENIGPSLELYFHPTNSPLGKDVRYFIDGNGDICVSYTNKDVGKGLESYEGRRSAQRSKVVGKDKSNLSKVLTESINPSVVDKIGILEDQKGLEEKLPDSERIKKAMEDVRGNYEIQVEESRSARKIFDSAVEEYGRNHSMTKEKKREWDHFGDMKLETEKIIQEYMEKFPEYKEIFAIDKVEEKTKEEDVVRTPEQRISSIDVNTKKERLDYLKRHLKEIDEQNKRAIENPDKEAFMMSDNVEKEISELEKVIAEAEIDHSELGQEEEDSSETPEQKISSAGSFEELSKALDEIGGLKGSQETFTPEMLKHVIVGVRAGEIGLNYVTRTGGLRSKVEELLKAEQSK